MARRIPKPPGFTFPGDRKPERAGGGKPPKRFRRFRVVAEDVTDSGVFPPVRDVYLESSHCPLMDATLFDNVTCEMMNCGVPVDVVADMVREFERAEIPVVFEPPGNMRGQLNPRKNGQTSIFD